VDESALVANRLANVYSNIKLISRPTNGAAAFAFVAGTVPRCPEWMGNAGFEWVYSFWMEPSKLWRRDLMDGPRFLFYAGMEFFRKQSTPRNGVPAQRLLCNTLRNHWGNE
jgi:hypothetical protein